MNKIVTLLIAITLFSCESSPPSTGGVDQMGNFIKGNINNNSGEVASKVIIKKVSINANSNSTIYHDSIDVGSDGTFKFENLPAGDFVITALNNSGKINSYKGDVAIEDNKSVSVEMETSAPVAVKGRLINSGISSAFIPGINKTIAINADGSYSFDNLPVGAYDIGFVSETEINFLPIRTIKGSDTVYIRDVDLATNKNRYSYFDGATNNAYSVKPVNHNIDENRDLDLFSATYYEVNGRERKEIGEDGGYAILLDNFNDNDVESQPYTAFEKVHWYGYDSRADNDYPENEYSKIIPDISEDGTNDFRDALVEETGMGSVVHVKFQLLYDNLNNYAGIGCSKDATSEYLDLTTLRSISFYAKGEGTLILKLKSKYVQSNYAIDQRWGYHGNYFTLTDEWKRYEILSNDFISEKGSPQDIEGITWEQVRDSIYGIEIQGINRGSTLDSAELYLDNIFFNGYEK